MNSYNRERTIKKKIVRLDGQGYRIEEKEEVVGKKTSNRRLLSLFSMASELGFAISIPIVGGVFLGKWLDGKFGTSPRLTLSLLALGVVMGSIALYNIIREGLQKD